MTEKIKLKFPEATYELIEGAAQLAGCSVKSFAAAAVLNEAFRIVQGLEQYTFNDAVKNGIELNEEEAKAILSLVDTLEADKREEADDAEAASECCDCDKACEKSCDKDVKCCESGDACCEAKEDCCCAAIAEAPTTCKAKKGKKHARK